MIQILKNPNYDFLGKRKYFYIVSGVVILAGIVSFIVRGPNYGIDFTGGSVVELHFDKRVEISEIRNKLSQLGISDATIQEIKELRYNYLIRTPPKEGIGEQIAALFTPSPRIEREELVGPSVSEGFRMRAIWAVLLGFVVILIYVWIRFTFKWGVCAVVALVHDVLVTVGVMSLLGKELTISTVAALLTIIGYSINDSIVISDRVRENLHGLRKRMLPDIVNTSVNQTLSRTILTSLTVLFVLLVLFFFGGRVIHDFALALIIGCISGVYSTVYILSALVIDWERRSATTIAARK
ncbi:MAG: protein translocase subunit SecF [Candidatus Stahlbacteria bacterium]|nr:protein translocase subunit SecF [Candidatus Stahlbacteria bacterium]